MKALAVFPNFFKERIRLIEIPVPRKKDEEVLVKTVYTGICKTDKEVIDGFYGSQPRNSNYLIIQHEAVGRVIMGDKNKIFKAGDLVVPTVRRGCGHCEACQKKRSDYCLTGEYKERGIAGLHGFASEYFTEDSKNLIKADGISEEEAVLIEPLSIIYKALERINYDWQFFNKFLFTEKTLIIGAGTIGQLCARVLEKNHGFNIYCADILSPDTKKAKLIAGHYIQVMKNNLRKVKKCSQDYELIFEASGSEGVFKNVISEKILAPNGILLLIGIPQAVEKQDLTIAHKEIALKNQSVIGIVNSTNPHFNKALKDIKQGLKVKNLITNIFEYKDFKNAINDFSRPESIKILLRW